MVFPFSENKCTDDDDCTNGKCVDDQCECESGYTGPPDCTKGRLLRVCRNIYIKLPKDMEWC